jgi:hypothetical protein
MVKLTMPGQVGAKQVLGSTILSSAIYFMFILSYEAGFYKPTILNSSGITANATIPGRLKHFYCWI